MFRFKNAIFWVTEAILLTSSVTLYKLIGVYSAYYSFAAYYSVFRTIHYFIDVKQDPTQKISFLDYIAYLLFFPAFSHGPIERAENFKIKDKKDIEVLFGFKRIAYGALKYIVYLHILSKISPVPFSYSDIFQWLIFTAYLGAIKLFILLSGDIDIVIGISSLLGFRISENYPKNPFLQPTLTKLWLNWQATIVKWLFGYIYYPLCRNRKNVYLKTAFILMIIGWGHLFYNAKEIPSLSLVMYYTLWGVFMGGALAFSKLIERKKKELRASAEQKYPKLSKVIYADNIFSKGVSVLITFTIFSVGLNSPLYLILISLI